MASALSDVPPLLNTLPGTERGVSSRHSPAAVTEGSAGLLDCELACSGCGTLNTSTNVFELVRANELIATAHVNTVLAIASVLYIMVNFVGAILNSYDNDCDRRKPGCSPATTPQVFHNLEFWSTFVFNVIDLIALSYSPQSSKYSHPATLKLLVFFNAGLAFGSCLLVTIDLEKFEILSHELEYTNELTIAIFDVIILMSIMPTAKNGFVSWIAVCVAGCVAVTQLGVYNLSGWTADGDSKGETAAHYLEFAFGAVSAGITFWFTMDNKISAEKQLRQQMFGRPGVETGLPN